MSGRIAKTMMWLLLAFSASAQAQTVVEYLHTDALGSVVAVTNASRTVLERREYEPYGHQLTPAVSNGPGYTGHVQDAATGLVYMQQRYYDAQIGRFLSVDPVAAREKGDNFNRYAYAFDNPYRFTDPTGREGTGCWNNGRGCGPATPTAAAAGQSNFGTNVDTAVDATQLAAGATAAASGELAPLKAASLAVGVMAEKVVKEAGPAANVVTAARAGAEVADGNVGEAASIVVKEGVEAGAVGVGMVAGGKLGTLVGHPEVGVAVGGVLGYTGVNLTPVQEAMDGLLRDIGNGLKEHEARMQYGAGQAMMGCGANCDM